MSLFFEHTKYNQNYFYKSHYVYRIPPLQSHRICTLHQKFQKKSKKLELGGTNAPKVHIYVNSKFTLEYTTNAKIPKNRGHTKSSILLKNKQQNMNFNKESPNLHSK